MAETSSSRTILWCVPRSVSTAFTLCLSAIGGIEVWFEPTFYCHVAKAETGLRIGENLPPEYIGNEEIYQKAAQIMNEFNAAQFRPEILSYAGVKRKIELASSRHVFVKDIPYVPADLIPHIPSGFKHTFLIRNPLRTINSYRAGIINALSRMRGEVINDTDFDVVTDNPYCPPGLFTKELHDLWKYVRDYIDENPIVIDGDDLLAEPAKVISAYCRAVGLPYDEKLLKWDSSKSLDVAQAWKLPADDLFLKIPKFYETAMGSDEFKPANPMPIRDQLTPDVIRSVDDVMGYYKEMYNTRMNPNLQSSIYGVNSTARHL